MIAAAAVLAMGVAGTAGQEPRLVDDTPHGPSEWYVALVERYRRGDHESVVAEPFPPEKVRGRVRSRRGYFVPSRSTR